METQKTHEQKMKEMRREINLMKERRTEKDRPTVWYNSKSGYIEIHFEKRTILAETTSIDRETSRTDSDRMAQGSGYKQVIYQTEEEEN